MQCEFNLLYRTVTKSVTRSKLEKKTKFYQAVTVKSGVDASKEEPAGPQILQSEFKDEVGQQHQCPHHHEL